MPSGIDSRCLNRVKTLLKFLTLLYLVLISSVLFMLYVDFMGDFKQKLKNAIEVISNKLYHESHRKEAMGFLRNIEGERGKTDPKSLRLSLEYAKDVLGSKKYAPWLYVYSAIAGEFKEGWIPDNYYGNIVAPKLKGDYGNLDSRNMLTNLLIKPIQSLDILYFVNNLFWTTEFEVCDEKCVADILFEKNEQVVFKIENSEQGKGIYFFSRDSFTLDKIKILGDGVFQSYIEQHAFFRDFIGQSVATLRITSICDDFGKIKVKAAYLKTGRDNETHIQATSSVRIPVNIENGQLNEIGYFQEWTSTKVHPDSKIPFANKVVPYFDECLSEVLRMHSRIPFVRCIGWDIVVDSSNQVQLIEWNGRHNDIKFSEATQGPCFTDLQWEKLKNQPRA